MSIFRTFNAVWESAKRFRLSLSEKTFNILILLSFEGGSFEFIVPGFPKYITIGNARVGGLISSPPTFYTFLIFIIQIFFATHNFL